MCADSPELEFLAFGIHQICPLHRQSSMCRHRRLYLRSPMHLERGEIVILAVIAAIAGLISMVGDLTASAIKRNYDIKDYGKLIPGHGGILDRFDSMIITAPIIYFLALHML